MMPGMKRAVCRWTPQLRLCSTSVTEMPTTNYTPKPYNGPSAKEALEKRKKFLHPINPWYYGDNPLLLVEGKMQYLWDEKQRRYLDLFGGVVTTSVGHAHPRLVEVVRDQADRLWHTTVLYLTPKLGEYCEELASTLPKDREWVIFPTNSGTESTELAVFMARQYTRNFEYITLRNGYHGIGAEAARSATPTRGWKWAVPTAAGHKYALCPDLYRGTFSGPDAVERYLDDLRSLIIETCGPVAGFGCEPVQGVGGTIPMPPGYMKGAYEIIRERGGVCISDEVQTGFGRLGTSFWGFEDNGVVPDIVVMAKSIANGWPMGAVACTREVANAMKGASFFNTFGGNPMTIAVALETLRIIKEDNLQQRCHTLGERMITGLKKLQKRYPIIGDVRGKGLMVGVELIKDTKTKEPAAEETNRVMCELREDGVLVGKGGTLGNVLRIKPPMCITEEDVDFFLHCFEKRVAAL